MKFKKFKKSIKDTKDMTKMINVLNEYINHLKSKHSTGIDEDGRCIIEGIHFRKIIKAYEYAIQYYIDTPNLKFLISTDRIAYIEDYHVGGWPINYKVSNHITFKNVIFDNSINFAYHYYNKHNLLTNVLSKSVFTNCKFIRGYFDGIDMRNARFNKCEFTDISISINTIFPPFAINDCIFTNVKRTGSQFPFSCSSFTCIYDETYIHELAVHLYNQCVKQNMYLELGDALLPIAQKFRPKNEELNELLKRGPGYIRDITSILVRDISNRGDGDTLVDVKSDSFSPISQIDTENQPKNINIDEVEV